MAGKELPTVAEIREWTDRQVIDAMQAKTGFAQAWREMRSAIARAEQAEMQRVKPTIFQTRKQEAISTVLLIEAWHGFKPSTPKEP